MARLIVTDQASADEARILNYLNDNAGLFVATQFKALFKKLYDRLAEFPASGTIRSKLGREIRMGVISPYVVFYQHTEKDDAVSIIRILHGSRNITRKLLKS